MTDDANLDVEAVLTEQQKLDLLGRAFAMNPHLSGAKVADVIDIYGEHDAFLDRREPWWDEHGQVVLDGLMMMGCGEGLARRLLGAASVAACLLLPPEADISPLAEEIVADACKVGVIGGRR